MVYWDVNPLTDIALATAIITLFGVYRWKVSNGLQDTGRRLACRASTVIAIALFADLIIQRFYGGTVQLIATGAAYALTGWAAYTASRPIWYALRAALHWATWQTPLKRRQEAAYKVWARPRR